MVYPWEVQLWEAQPRRGAVVETAAVGTQLFGHAGANSCRGMCSQGRCSRGKCNRGENNRTDADVAHSTVEVANAWNATVRVHMASANEGGRTIEGCNYKKLSHEMRSLNKTAVRNAAVKGVIVGVRPWTCDFRCCIYGGCNYGTCNNRAYDSEGCKRLKS